MKVETYVRGLPGLIETTSVNSLHLDSFQFQFEATAVRNIQFIQEL